jgi:hypothetical protein
MVKADDCNPLGTKSSSLRGIAGLPIRIIVRRTVNVYERWIFAGVAEIGTCSELLVVMLRSFWQSKIPLIQKFKELPFETRVAQLL